MQQVQGIVAMAKGEPVQQVTINVPDPGPGEAVVQVQACGVCHTDLHYREGGINDEFPFLLGHEAAGVVEAVGEGVTDVAPGDFVILNWRAVCGSCRACTRGEPWYCFATHNATQKMTLEDGTELSPALGIGAFAEKTLVAAGQCTKVDADARAAAVGLLGCGVMAGLGAAINTGNVEPRHVGRGDRLRRRGRRRDRGIGPGRGDDGSSRSTSTTASSRAPRARRHAHRQRKEADPVEAIQELTGGNGADVVIDAVGRPETWKQAFYARDLAGTVVLVGVPTPDMKLPDMPLIDVFGRGGALKSSWYGDCLPSRDFPMLVDLYRQGRLDLDAFVTEEIGIDDVEEAFDKMHAGDVLRSVVVFCDAADRPRRQSAARSASTARPSTSTTTSGWSATTTACVVIDAPHDVDDDPRRRRRPHGRDPAPTPTTTMYGWRPRCARRPARRSCCIPPTGRCGS